MKIPIFVALGALCVAPGLASAQTVPGQNNGNGVQSKDAPDLDTLLPQGRQNPYIMRGSTVSPDDNTVLLFPAWLYNRVIRGRVVANLSMMPSSVTFESVALAKGEALRVNITNSDLKTVLEAVAARAGMKVVVDPALSNSYYLKGSFGAANAKALLGLIGGATVERWQSKAGTYFFAQTKGETAPLPQLLPSHIGGVVPGTTIIPTPPDSIRDKNDPFVWKPEIVPPMPKPKQSQNGKSVDPSFVQPPQPAPAQSRYRIERYFFPRDLRESKTAPKTEDQTR